MDGSNKGIHPVWTAVFSSLFLLSQSVGMSYGGQGATELVRGHVYERPDANRLVYNLECHRRALSKMVQQLEAIAVDMTASRSRDRDVLIRTAERLEVMASINAYLADTLEIMSRQAEDRLSYYCSLKTPQIERLVDTAERWADEIQTGRITRLSEVLSVVQLEELRKTIDVGAENFAEVRKAFMDCAEDMKHGAHG